MTAPSPSPSAAAGGSAPGAAVPPSHLTAEACDRIVQAIRGKAEETIAHLQQDVFRLIDQAGPAASDPPSPAAGQGAFRAQAGYSRPAWDGGEPGPREPESADAIRQAVRQEIERLDIAAIVAQEVRHQMRSFAEQLQERMQRQNPRGLKKAGPLAARQRR